jgi:hypothetical protein
MISQKPACFLDPSKVRVTDTSIGGVMCNPLQRAHLRANSSRFPIPSATGKYLALTHYHSFTAYRCRRNVAWLSSIGEILINCLQGFQLGRQFFNAFIAFLDLSLERLDKVRVDGGRFTSRKIPDNRYGSHGHRIAPTQNNHTKQTHSRKTPGHVTDHVHCTNVPLDPASGKNNSISHLFPANHLAPP